MKKVLLMMMLFLSACMATQTMTQEEILPYIKETYALKENTEILEKEYDNIYVVLYDNYYSIFVKKDSQKYQEAINGILNEDVKRESVEGYDIYISLNQNLYYAYELYNNCDAIKGTVDPNHPFIVIITEGGDISWIN